MSDDELSGGEGMPEATVGSIAMPQKRHYRQRAHSNPLSYHSMDVFVFLSPFPLLRYRF